MLDLTDEFRVSVAMILGMIAALATLLVWREKDIPQTIQQLKILFLHSRTGLASPSIERSMRILIVGIALFIVGFSLCVVFFSYAFHYMKVIGLLIGKSGALDLGLFERLKLHAEGIRNDAVSIGRIAIFVLLGDWIFAVFSRSSHIQIEADAIPEETHPYMVLDDWRAAPAALWEHRIEYAAKLLSGMPQLESELVTTLESGAWRREWTSWATCAAAYQFSVFNSLGNPRTSATCADLERKPVETSSLNHQPTVEDLRTVKLDVCAIEQTETIDQEQQFAGRDLPLLRWFALGVFVVGFWAVLSERRKNAPELKNRA